MINMDFVWIYILPLLAVLLVMVLWLAWNKFVELARRMFGD